MGPPPGPADAQVPEVRPEHAGERADHAEDQLGRTHTLQATERADNRTRGPCRSVVPVRESRNVAGPALIGPDRAWATFVASLSLGCEVHRLALGRDREAVVRTLGKTK
ncbi:DUF397 domain-containing protein [Streptomyces hainanensis]|uniref:DUF397 domain-containing protein n=1 Tax=Streptomyces hainanensis TaxID=402648 RepID=A0A4R4SQ11_9ACTN|nr:DUF397 domain-containing protein [Streptomyces hainanensis]TDC65988.1 DUF397 domain-containing protein [Streptomyces hainanensis]